MVGEGAYAHRWSGVAESQSRSCCSSYENTWHGRPCTVNGRTGLWDEAQVVEVCNMRLVPYRQCCNTVPGSPHWQGCGTYFFVEGQTIIKPEFNPMDPWGPARLRIREDTVASDRTFENETRPL